MSEEKKRMGRPPFEPTDKDRRAVAYMASVGCPQEEICAVLGITIPTLRKYFKEEFDIGFAQGNVKLRKTAYERANNGSDRMLQFLCQTRLRMSFATEENVDATKIASEIKNLIGGAEAATLGEEQQEGSDDEG